MNNNLFEKALEWVCDNFKKDTSKMLVITGTIGWALSSLAQIMAIVVNPKINSDQKTFLIPQETLDAIINVCGFFGITMFTKKAIAKLASTGKIAPQKVRDFLNQNKDLYKDKVGKVDFDLDEVLKNNSKFPDNSYYTYKNFVTTVGTVGAGVLSSNIVTPLLRNAMASKVQKSCNEIKNNQKPNNNPYNRNINYSGNMKV